MSTDSPSPTAHTPRSSTTLFRRIISLTSQKDKSPPTPPPEPENALVKKASLLVPPNYVKAFISDPHLPYLTLPLSVDWADEIALLFDNGLRQELLDMYEIFVYMEQRPLMLSTPDIVRFNTWFSTFFALLSTLFELEERALFPWVEGVDRLDRAAQVWDSARGRVCSQLNEVRRARMKADVMRLANEITRCETMFAGRPVAPVLPELAGLVDEFVHHLLAYLEVKRASLAACIRGLLSQRDVGRFYKSFFELSERMDWGGCTVVMMTRWMPRRAAARWRKRRMSMRARKLYVSWEERFVVEHSNAVTEFQELVRVSEEERVRQAEEHGAALARAQEPVLPDYTASEASSCAWSLVRGGFDVLPDSLSVVM